MKKGLLLSFALLVLAACPVSAGNVAKNKNTGYRSLNTVMVKNTSSTEAVTIQNALVGNGVLVLQKTGGNKVVGNTTGSKLGDPSVVSGNARSNTVITNNVNNSSTDITGCNTCEGTNTVVNNTTGAKSVNIASVTTKNETESVTVQEAVVVNVVVSAQNTGENKANFNTGSGEVSVTSGNGVSDTTITNNVNNSGTTIGTETPSI